ncbi:hypothetical protein [Bariatricus sp. SGI.019]|uniref:hypothetical protein n=1 Tax=Bariatricus sp. SGI.019 TaxID=3420548 RepID=UPI003D022395
MFKKILQEIGELRKQIDGLYDAITKRSYILKHYEEEIDSLRKSLNVQTELNRQLITGAFENNQRITRLKLLYLFHIEELLMYLKMVRK